MWCAFWMSLAAWAESPSMVTADGAFVLEHVEVDAEVQGGIAVVRVEQQFHNPFTEPVDATYLFPLPPNAAVRGMEMTCGGRRIVGTLKPRAEARQAYESAAAAGQQAALLEQERPNLFRQSVAALCPGDDVEVALEYAAPLTLDDGHRELVFPTTVGPRYQPGDVPEPPLTTLPPHTVSVTVSIDEGMGVDGVWSDTHAIEVDEYSQRAVVRTDPTDAWPNKDFHLAWSYGGASVRLGTLAVPPTADEDGYLSVTIEPAATAHGPVRGRELLFVIDESCSMAGEPFATAVATVTRAMSSMRPDDRFNLVRFSNEASSLFTTPQPANAATIRAANEWLTTFDGEGTEMTRGIVQALDMPGDPERLRLVLLLTDGYIGNENEVLATITDHLGRSRLFSLGVGAAVNRFLLDAIAEVGRGAVAYQLPDTPVEETVERFYARIDRPALTDLALRWSGIEIIEVYPEKLPDLFAGQPLQVLARYRSVGPQVSVILDGRVGPTPYHLTRVIDVAHAEAHDALPVAWAREKIDALEIRHHFDEVALEREVTAVALRHRLVTGYTSLVAVATGPSRCGAATTLIDVPSMAPATMDTTAFGGLGSMGSGMGGGGTASGIGGLGTRGRDRGRADTAPAAARSGPRRRVAPSRTADRSSWERWIVRSSTASSGGTKTSFGTVTSASWRRSLRWPARSW